MFPPDVVVVREVPWREEEGRAVILAPRYSDTFFGRLMRRFFGDSTVKIKLDDLGTHAWKMFDGTLSLEDIAVSLEAAFGEKAESARDRLDLFLSELHRNGWVTCLQRALEEGGAVDSIETSKAAPDGKASDEPPPRAGQVP